MYRNVFSDDTYRSIIKKLESEKNITKVNEEIQSLRQWIKWLHSKKIISEEKQKVIKDEIDTFVRNKGLNVDKRKYNSDSNFDYKGMYFIIFICLLFSISAFALIFYKYRFSATNNESVGRVLPFKGVIESKSGGALTSKRDVRFTLYKSPTEGQPLYQGNCVGEYGLTPQFNGNFSVLIGEDCNMQPIHEDLFKDNPTLFLGVTIGNDQELKPRYQIMTSSYQSVISAMQGKKVGSGISSIPYIDDKGTINLDPENPVIQSSKSILTIKGKALSLNATGDVEGNITLNPGNQANVLIENGRLGIGSFMPKYLLTAESKQPFSTVGSIRNLSVQDDPQTSALRIGLGTDVKGNGSLFIEFYAGATEVDEGKKVGAIRLNNEGVVYETGGADFAEYFNITYIGEVLPGEIISLSSTGLHPAIPGEVIIGAVSDSAGFVGNSKDMENDILVGLVGQIHVWTSTIGGDIKTGSRIGASQIEGFGTVVTQDQHSIGYALQDSTKESFSNEKCPVKSRKLRDPNGKKVRCGQLSVIVNTD